jgi:hypothetical protein
MSFIPAWVVGSRVGQFGADCEKIAACWRVYGAGGFDGDAFSEGLASMCQFWQIGNEEWFTSGENNVRGV